MQVVVGDPAREVVAEPEREREAVVAVGHQPGEVVGPEASVVPPARVLDLTAEESRDAPHAAGRLLDDRALRPQRGGKSGAVRAVSCPVGQLEHRVDQPPHVRADRGDSVGRGDERERLGHVRQRNPGSGQRSSRGRRVGTSHHDPRPRDGRASQRLSQLPDRPRHGRGVRNGIVRIALDGGLRWVHSGHLTDASPVALPPPASRGRLRPKRYR